MECIVFGEHYDITFIFIQFILSLNIILIQFIFRHLSSQLTEMEKLVDKMLTTEFQKYATADLNRPLGEEDIVLDAVSTYYFSKSILALVSSKQSIVHLPSEIICTSSTNRINLFPSFLDYCVKNIFTLWILTKRRL